jgi:membrane protease YdiL (CAAX protease family)
MGKWLGGKLHFDWKIAVLTVVSTLLLLMDFYQVPLLPWGKWFPGWAGSSIISKDLDRTLLYLLITLVVVLLVFRESPAQYGFRLGDWRAGVVLTLGGMAVLFQILWAVCRMDGSLRTFYAGQTLDLPWSTLLNLFGWEFLFRGWLLFGYARKFGPEALWLQAVPFALAHIGKPELEAFSTILSGFAFGWLAYRTKSFLYPFLIHWYLGTCLASKLDNSKRF